MKLALIGDEVTIAEAEGLVGGELEVFFEYDGGAGKGHLFGNVPMAAAAGVFSVWNDGNGAVAATDLYPLGLFAVDRIVFVALVVGKGPAAVGV